VFLDVIRVQHVLETKQQAVMSIVVHLFVGIILAVVIVRHPIECHDQAGSVFAVAAMNP
jgi:hypothetical protein